MGWLKGMIIIVNFVQHDGVSLVAIDISKHYLQHRYLLNQ
jgi:hypothetical protein